MIARMGILLLELLLLLPASTGAQIPQDLNLDVQSDLRQEQQEFVKTDVTIMTPRERTLFDRQQIRPELLSALPPEVQAEKAKPFEFDVSLPLTYNTNILRSNRDEQADGRLNPDLAFLWSQRVWHVKLSLLGDINFDRYLTERGADGDEIYFSLKVGYTPPASTWSIFIGYRPTLDFATTFSSLVMTLHDFVVGASSSFEIALADKKPLMLDVDCNLIRRDADPRHFAATTGTVGVKASYMLNKQWSISSQTELKVRWYDHKIQGSSRHDTIITVLSLVRWQPGWLAQSPGLKDADIVFMVSFMKDDSSLSTASFTQWDIGPSMNFSWRF